MAKRELFDTDGIRGIANRYPMTAEIALRVGKAVAHVLAGKKKRARIIIGKDTRISGYMFETALTAGLCSMGAEVLLVGPIPTPGIAHLTKSFAADAGIVISASHNPTEHNGIKIFSHDGFKLPDSVEAEIEEYVLNCTHKRKGYRESKENRRCKRKIYRICQGMCFKQISFRHENCA